MISPSLRQRLQVPVSASTPQRAVPMDNKRRLKQLDIYRKVPVDLTETSRGGLLATLVSVLALVLLAGMELKSLFQPITETSVGINQDQSSTLRVHVNLTLVGIACEFVSVDLENKLGVSRFAIEASTLVKVSNGRVVGKMEQIKRESATRAPTTGSAMGSASKAVDVGSLSEWERMVQTSRVPLLVNLYSSRNSTHSSEFRVVFERAAEQAAARGADMAFASLDCLPFKQVCEWEHVQAYPSVRLFVPDGAGKSKVYTGARDVDALVQFALTPKAAQVRDNTKACDVHGYLDVARVPGKLSIHASALGADLDHQIISSNHVLHWLGFGSDSGEGSTGAGKEFYGDKQFHTHYLKIVSTQRPQQPLTYEYSMTTDCTAGDNSTGVDFVFDISPLQITTTRRRKDLIQGVTAMLALLGGVFSASFMIQGVLHVLLCWTLPALPPKQH